MRLLIWILLTGCVVPTTSDPNDDDSAAPEGSWHALVTHAPFTGDSVLATVAEDLTVSDDVLGLAGSDWSVGSADGDPWLIGRFFIDTVRRYDGFDFSAPSLEFSTGPGTNPQGVAVCGGRLYVPRYDLGEELGGDIAVFDPTSGGPMGSVDLTAYEPHGDGTAEPAATVVLDETLYVALQCFDRNAGWAPDPVGVVLAVDCATGDVLEALDVGPNPRLSRSGDDLAIRFDGGVDLYDRGDGVLRELLRDEPDEETTAFAAAEEYGVLVTEQDATSTVWCVDLQTGARTALIEQPQRAWGSVAAPDGAVWVLWRDHWATDAEVEPGGIGVYDPAACEERTDPWLSFDADPYAVGFHEVPG